MKKFLSILFILTISVSAAFAGGNGSPFVDALDETVRSFSLDENGYRADLSVDGQAFSAGILYDGDSGITDIDLEQYGRLQIDGEKTVFLNSGIPFVLNYSAWPGLAKTIADPGNFGRRMEAALIGLAAKVKGYLVDPFVTVELGKNTIILHLDFDDREIKKQLLPFLTELLQDKTIRTAYPAVVQILRRSGVWIPANADDLPQYLVSSIPGGEYQRMRLTGDLMITNPAGKYPEIVFSGNYYSGYYSYMETYPLYFEFSHTDGKPVVIADGDLPFGGITFRLDGNHFRFEPRPRKGGAPSFSVDGTFNRATGEVSAIIRDSAGEQTGEASGFLLRDRLDLNIRNYRDNISIYVKYGESYLHGNVAINSPGRSYGQNYDLWIGRAPDQAFTVRFNALEGGGTEDAFELLAGRNRLELQFLRNGRQLLNASAQCDPDTGETRIHGEALDRWNRPYRIELSGTGGEYEAAFSYPYYNWRVEGNGSIHFDPAWLLQSAVFDVRTSGLGYTDVMQYVLERTEDTAERMAYRLRKDDETLLQLEAELRNEGFGRGIVLRILRGENTVFSAAFMPVPKEEIVPIDISNGVYVTPELVSTMLQTLLR